MPTTSAKPSSKRHKRGTNHRGVTIVKPRPEAGKLCYALRWRDLDNPARQRTEVLLGITERRAAEPFARRKSLELDTARLAIEVNGRCAVRVIADECAHYLDEAGASARKGPNVGDPLSVTTMRRYTDALDSFTEWCTSMGYRTLKQLGRAELAAWKSSRRKQLTKAGEARKMSTINFELKPVRQMLLMARGQGRYESLDSDAIRSALARYSETKPAPVCHPVAEVKRILQAAIRRDTERRGGCLAAPAFALALLGGLRRGEITATVVGSFEPRRPTVYDPQLTHPVLCVPELAGRTKTGARVVECLPYSPLLVELLDALTRDRSAHEPLVDVDYEAIGAEATALGIEFKSLRSTAVSYTGPVQADAKSKAGRYGHSRAVAEMHYEALPLGSPATTSSLDEIMQCEPELRAIIDAVNAAHTLRDSRGRRRAG